MLVRQQRLHLRMIEQPRHELLKHLAGLQAFAVLGERRWIPHQIVRRQADEPAIQQVVVQLLHQLPLRADARIAPGSTGRSATAPVAPTVAPLSRRAGQSSGSARPIHRAPARVSCATDAREEHATQAIHKKTAHPDPGTYRASRSPHRLNGRRESCPHDCREGVFQHTARALSEAKALSMCAARPMPA